MASVADYRWTADSRLSILAVAGCVTIVRGLDVAGVVLAFGGDPAAAPEPFEELLEDPWGTPDTAAIGRAGDAVLAVEFNGFAGSRPEVLRPASANGLAASVYWNEATGRKTFSYAQTGQLVTTFDPLFPDDRQGAEPDRLVAEMADLGFGMGGENVPASFVLAERVTGVRLGREDLFGLEDVWRLARPLPDQYRYPALSVPGHGLSFKDAQLAGRIVAAGPERQRVIAAIAADRAAAATGFDRISGVREALARLKAAPGEALAADDYESVRRTWNAGSPAGLAAFALYSATNPDPLTAALDAVLYALYASNDALLPEFRRL